MSEVDFPPGYDELKASFGQSTQLKPRLNRRPMGDAPEPLDPIYPAMLDGIPVPERRWLVPDWIPMARVTALYGAGGEGKTLLAQMLSTSCAIGAEWIGLRARRCRSLLLFCEDDREEMHRRQDDINRHLDCQFADLASILWLPRLGCDNALMTFEGRPCRTALFEQILTAAKEYDAELIITDTLADVFNGNENDRGQARAFAQAALGLLARETTGAVLALAHPSRNGVNSGSGESGSTAWVGTFRSQLYLTTPKSEAGEPSPDPDLRTLTRRKSNAARRDETIELRWKDGVFMPVGTAAGIMGSIGRRACERVFLDQLQKVKDEGRWVSESPNAGNYAPRIFARRPDCEGYKMADLKAAMEKLFFQGEIKNAPYGSPSDQTFRIVRAELPPPRCGVTH